MMNIPPLARNIGAGVLLFALLFFAYKFTLGKKADVGAITESGPAAVLPATGDLSVNAGDIAVIEKAHEHLKVLSNLDTSILDDDVLRSLKDFRIPLSPSDPSLVSKGRDDPFAPFPFVGQKKGVSGSR